jgi:hypothetical protein
MTAKNFDLESFRRNVEMMDSPEWKATRDEVQSLIGRATRLIDRQVSDLRAILMTPEQRELLQSLVVSMELRYWLEGAERNLPWHPFTINESDFKENLLEASLFLSQHGDQV